MGKKVTLIDYGIGNLFSIANALKVCGADLNITEFANKAKSADRLILPGVGAFKDGMAGLESRGLADAIRQFTDYERPFLGICLGMQMMLSNSEEFGNHKGLGIIPGSVKAIEPIDLNANPHKIPHIGWNNLHKARKARWSNTLLDLINERTPFYFVHSFTAVPENENHRLADTYYGGRQLSAVIAKYNLYGTQFHPEKSGKHGLVLLRTFLEI
jgi:glutamine amidotransferase